MAEEIHVGDVGTELKFTISDAGTVVDVSGTSAKVVLVRRPDGTEESFTAAFTSDGTDGAIQYDTVSGDLDMPGIWRAQARVTWSGGDTYTTDTIRFIVYPNVG